MENIITLMGVALSALLSENFILVNCMGIGTRRRSFADPMDALKTGYCLSLVMVLGCSVAWLTDYFLLDRYGWQHFRLMTLSLVIPGLVAGLRVFFRACLPELSRRIDENLAAISTNCAALGSALLITQRGYGFGTAVLFALMAGVGATVALASFASLRAELSLDNCPRSFQGIPIQLITASLMALAMVGFYGLHLG